MPAGFSFAIGSIAADLVQHAVCSLGKKGCTPGVATSAVLCVYVTYFFRQPDLRGLLDDPSASGAIGLGAAFIAGKLLSPSEDRHVDPKRGGGSTGGYQITWEC